MNTFYIAIVGCGNVSRMHFDAYLPHLDRVRVVAVCDPLRERVEEVQQRYGIEQGFVSLDEMIRKVSWEVGVVCTPTPVRKQTVSALAKAGKHVFVEKPFADTLEEAEQMVTACERAGVKLAVNQNFRYHYPFDRARDLIEQGRIGRVLSVSHQDLMFRQDSGWRIKSDRHALSVMGIHWLDGFRWMLRDEATSIVCETRSSAAIECAGETDASVQVLFEGGAVATYVESFSSPFKRTETVVVGDEGALVLSYQGAALYSKDNRAEPKERWDNPYSNTNKPRATFKDLDILLTAIEQGSRPSNDGRDNLRTVALLDGAYRSASEHRAISLPEGVLI